MDNKGDDIRFSKGSYAGMRGWLDASKPDHPPKMYNVIIQISPVEDKVTRVMKTSVRFLVNDTIPVSMEEAVLKQHRDVDVAMDRLAALLAQCMVRPASNEIHRIFENKIDEAWSSQTMKGEKATWRVTEFVEDEI